MEQELSIDKHCANCGAAVAESYCANCGQRFRGDRLSLRALLIEIPSRWLSLDRGFFLTFWLQFRSPGTVARRFVSGERVKFTNPFTYFLIGAALQLLMLLTMEDIFRAQLISQVEQSPETLEQIQSSLGENAIQKYADIYISIMHQAYTYLGFIFLCLPYAVLMRLFSKQQRNQYNNAETLVLSFYTMGHFVLMTGLLGFVTLQVAPSLHPVISVVIYSVFCMLSTRGFYSKDNRGYFGTFLAMLLTFLCFLTALIVAVGIGLASSKLPG